MKPSVGVIGRGRRGLAVLAALALPAFAQAGEWAGDRIRVVIIDGQGGHDWRSATRQLRRDLQASGRFAVEVATAPHPPLPPLKPAGTNRTIVAVYREDLARYRREIEAYRRALDAFGPDLTACDVVLCNYDGDPWSPAFREALAGRVRAGKVGLVVVGPADRAFAGWKEWGLMTGLGWRADPKAGMTLKVGADGKAYPLPRGLGKGASLDPPRLVLVTVRDPSHPITRGMPTEWLHGVDQVEHDLRGPLEGVHLLCSYHSDKENSGTGDHEPAAWTVEAGRGRVFVTPMGHGRDALRCAGFASLLARGAEWAATGEVTLPLPAPFPTRKEPRSVP